MGAHRITPQRASDRVNNGLPDPLGLGKASVWEPGRRRPWPLNHRRVMSDGYVSVKVQDNGRFTIVPEHRLVMEKILERPLEKGESARHKSDDTLDNRPENLMLYQGERPVDLEAAVKRARRPAKRKRTTVYALLEIPEKAPRVRARTAREAEESTDEQVVAISLSRLRKLLA